MIRMKAILEQFLFFFKYKKPWKNHNIKTFDGVKTYKNAAGI